MTGKKILIIEDNLANMELITDLLEIARYVVLQAETAEEGIALAKAESPGLILMDIALPGMDGLSATRILKQEAKTKNTSIIALTSYAMERDKEEALAAGCETYMTKPIDTREFPLAIAHFIESASEA